MQADLVLIAAERELMERAEQVVLLVDGSKVQSSSGHLVCGLHAIDRVITNDGLPPEARGAIEAAGVHLVIAPAAG